MKVSVIGAAGVVGSAASYELAVHGIADELVMIDARDNLMKSHRMDIAAATYEQDVKVIPGTFENLVGSDVVLLATQASTPAGSTSKERLICNTLAFKDIAWEIKQHCPKAIIITASNPVDPLNYSLSLSGFFDRKQLLGYDLNDTIRFQIYTAQELGVKPTRVSVASGGSHAREATNFFSSAKLDGKPIKLTEANKHNIQKQVSNYIPSLHELNAGRTAGWTCAVGISKLVRAIKEDARTLVPCSIVLEGEYGYRAISMGVPSIIGKNGLIEILKWDLPADERKAFEESAARIKSDCEVVVEKLGLN